MFTVLRTKRTHSKKKKKCKRKKGINDKMIAKEYNGVEGRGWGVPTRLSQVICAFRHTAHNTKGKNLSLSSSSSSSTEKPQGHSRVKRNNIKERERIVVVVANQTHTHTHRQFKMSFWLKKQKKKYNEKRIYKVEQ